MRKHAFLATLVTLFANATVTAAQVEPRMAGVWQSGENGQSLHIQPDGRYQVKEKDRVVDSGSISGSNGSWKLKSDSGRSDYGTFSFISGNMHLHGGTMGGAWSKSSGAGALQTMPRSQTYSSMYGHGQRAELPGYAAKRDTASSPPSWGSSSSASPGTMGSQPGSTGSQPGATGSQSVAESGAPPSEPAAKPGKRGWSKTISEYASGLGKAAKTELLGPPGNMYGSSSQQATPYNRGYTGSQPTNGAPPKGDYHSPFWANAPGKHINASDMNRVGTGRPQNETTEHWEHVQWQNRPAQPGWQTVPRGGYIPVMKDGKARRYWGH